MAEKYTEAQKRASYKYQADRVKIQILVTPEQREKYKAHAESKNTSLTKLIIELLNSDMEAHNIIKSMIAEYENRQCNYDCEEYRKQGAIEVLERLLEEA